MSISSSSIFSDNSDPNNGIRKEAVKLLSKLSEIRFIVILEAKNVPESARNLEWSHLS